MKEEPDEQKTLKYSIRFIDLKAFLWMKLSLKMATFDEVKMAGWFMKMMLHCNLNPALACHHYEHTNTLFTRVLLFGLGRISSDWFEKVQGSHEL